MLFLGRYDEPRKGMAVFLEALPAIVAAQPDIEVLVIGRGDEEKLLREAGPYAKHLRLMGAVTDEEKAAALRSADIYVAPNLGGESFGIVLVEAMAAGTAVVASDLNAFERVLDGERPAACSRSATVPPSAARSSSCSTTTSAAPSWSRTPPRWSGASTGPSWPSR